MDHIDLDSNDIKENSMETVGWIATVVVGLVALVGVVTLIRELPGIRRYLKIKAM